MNEFEEILEDSIEQIANDESTMEEVLARHPLESAELEPYLRSAEQLKRGREVAPSPFFEARLRSQLMRTIKSAPRPAPKVPFFFQRMALNVGVLFLMLAFTSTAFAQTALPGESLYSLKLASENVWRALTTDPLGTDLELSNRRINEYVAVSQDAARRARVLSGYHDLLVRFETEDDALEKARILRVLQSQQESLREAGLSIPELDSYVTRPTPKP